MVHVRSPNGDEFTIVAAPAPRAGFWFHGLRRTWNSLTRARHWEVTVYGARSPWPWPILRQALATRDEAEQRVVELRRALRTDGAAALQSPRQP
jgi:hypothetical protein